MKCEWEDFNELYRTALFETTETDKQLIAKDVVSQVPDEHMQTVCEWAMAFAIANRLGKTSREPLTRETPARPVNRMAELLERRTPHVGNLLASRITIDNQLRFLADLNKRELLESAQINRAQAAGHVMSANQKERLAAAMNNKQTVADLSDAKIEKAWWQQ